MLDDAETPPPAPEPEKPSDPYAEEALRLGWAKSRIGQWLVEMNYEIGQATYGARRLYRELEGVLQSAESMLANMPKAKACRDPLAAVLALDERFHRHAQTIDDTYVSRWVNLKKEESYEDFKFVVGRIVKLPGWSLTEARTDNEIGTVDYRFHHDPSGARFTIYVGPGDSETCRIQEIQEVRSVTVKKIVCNGEVKGEMAGAVLTAPMEPKSGDKPYDPNEVQF